MENKKSPNFIFLILAFILGLTLFKQFDFENLKFKHSGLAIVYMITFLILIYLFVKDYKKRTEK